MANSENPELSIIILNYNVRELLLNCLESVFANKGKLDRWQVIVVDNASTDDSVSKIQSYKSQVKIIKNKENLGFAGGNNVGIKYALKRGADAVLILNNDTIVEKSFVKNLVRAANKADIISPKIYFAKGYEFHKDRYKESEKGKVIWYAGGIHDWNNVYASHLGVDEVDHGQFDGVRTTDFVTGCLFIVRREVLERVGFFDERYCLYFEDSDLGKRIEKVGLRLVIDPRIKLWHKVAQSSGIGSPLNDYFLTRNRLLFGTTYATTRTKFALLREAVKKLFIGTPAQKIAVRDFFMRNFGWGSWNKKVSVPGKQ